LYTRYPNKDALSLVCASVGMVHTHHRVRAAVILAFISAPFRDAFAPYGTTWREMPAR
jgi:hypothetical protein